MHFSIETLIFFYIYGLQKILLGQVTSELSTCSIHQIGKNLNLLSPSSCSSRKHRKEQHKDTTKVHGLITIIFTCEYY